MGRSERSERTVRRLAELKLKHGASIAQAQLYRAGRSSNCNTDRAATVSDPHQLTRQQHQATRRAQIYEHGSVARKASRRAMNAMKKSVEIADGSSDFPLLMVAAFGKGIMRYWKYAKEVFEDNTGLRLIQETEDDQDDS